MQSAPPKRYQQLQPEDHGTLASLVQQKYSVRAMAQVLDRSPSKVSRELQRNAQPTGYASTPARACALQRRWQSRPPGKLHRDGILFALMRHFLGQRWSPEQLALTLARIFPKGHEHRVSGAQRISGSLDSDGAVRLTVSPSPELAVTLQAGHSP